MGKFNIVFWTCLSFLIICASVSVTNAQTEKPEKVGICDVLRDPGTYNHKLIELTGFVTRGFEDSSLFDPACTPESSIWVEVGGKGGTGVMYCCGFTPTRVRPKDLVVEGITVPLVVDEPYANFDKVLEARRGGAITHATLVGRFFSGKKIKYAKGESWAGFGHFGMFSLFAIQQVVAVDQSPRPGIDRGASIDQPNLGAKDCTSYSMLMDQDFASVLDQQKKAESGARAWSLDDPKRVAAEELSRHAKAPTPEGFKLTETLRKEGRVVYEWQPGKRTETRYMIVVNRPYLLSFYAADPSKTAWVAAAAYSICG